MSRRTTVESQKGVLDQWDREHSWHPFAQMSEYCALPQVQVERAQGCWLWDVEGRRYLDGNASIWTNVHGHNDPDLNAALLEQASKVAHSTYLGLSHPAGAELGRRLVELSPPGLQRVMFSDNGSNAIEIALKQSFQFWQLQGESDRVLAVGMEDAYHGDTFGTMAVGDSPGFHGRFSRWCFESRVFERPRDESVAEARRSLRSLEAVLEAEQGKVACVVLEPWVQGAAGMRLQARGFVKSLEALCRRFGAHLILDEVFVGFGRMGNFFVCRQEGVEPDFLCLAKGLSAGYLPLAATLTRVEIYEAFLGTMDSGRAFIHGHTFTGNPLAAAVALASIQKLERLIESGELEQWIASFGRQVREAFEGHANVSELRVRGMAAAVDLCPAEGESEWSVNDRVGMQVCVAARSEGVLLRPLRDSLLIVPPLVISEEEIAFLIRGILSAIDRVIKERIR
ncbi:adenosylmethionine--8-amino-7-oxononanoate transaminase [Pelagicoccus sp. SDUM812005]|uniref:adenosylmethionine--8-amino-7-oxononanoate transaminase n=1 Tax=Pelagicoccus sp. SDUM812005 TaxID=3041257 RepID=UPI00280FCF90|nr:adenosylmethionine--8-amino-7-oxononanoate transaminase [Pelagicoccus sp. SDUM812005]MDQ8182790.1 adenosylmethionine--8-amino-7-oxononanoate transaminase [Pelagicoccus sp. SDUM812005]